jgi:hypothetical protein
MASSSRFHSKEGVLESGDRFGGVNKVRVNKQ